MDNSLSRCTATLMQQNVCSCLIRLTHCYQPVLNDVKSNSGSYEKKTSEIMLTNYEFSIRNIDASNSDDHKTERSVRYGNSRQEGRRRKDKREESRNFLFKLEKGAAGSE